MPLLSEEAEKGGDTPEKEVIEMMETEKDDTNEKEKDGKKKKEKKEKKPKEKKPKKEPGPSCIDTLTQGLNLTERDDKAINADINLFFDDVIAEPASSQGFDGIWKVAYILFSHTKLWFYRLFAALLAIPAAIVWGLLFSIITVLYIWVLAPMLKIFDLEVAIVRRIINGIMFATVEPVCAALGAVFSKMNVSQERRIVQDA